MILLLISFIAGALTVLAPCILPLLPVIVGGSLGSQEVDKKKAVIITLALGVSVIVFTLLLKVSTLFISVPESFWRSLSGIIIILFGFVTLFPALWEKISFLQRFNKQSNKVLTIGWQKKSFWGDIIIGAALGPIFSSCSPTYVIVLATILPSKPLVGFVYLLSYTFGLCIMLLFVSLVGQRVLQKLNIASDPRGALKRSLGLFFIVVGLGICFGVDKKIEVKLAASGIFDITKVEQRLLNLNH